MTEYTQRELVPVLVGLVDAASAKGATAHRDIARSRLREVLRDEHWNTSFVLNNLGRKRCRYIAGLGQPVPYRWIQYGWKGAVNTEEKA